MVTRAAKKKSSCDFQMKDIITESWKLLKGSKGPIWLGLFNAVLIGIMIPLLFAALTNQHPLSNSMHFVSIIISTAITSPIFTGIMLIGAKRARGKTVSYNEAFLYFNRYLPLAAAAIIIFILREVSSGFYILHPVYSSLTGILAVFSVVVSVFLMLTLPLIADKKYDPFHAMVESIKKVATHWIKIFGLLILLMLTVVVIYLILFAIAALITHAFSAMLGAMDPREMMTLIAAPLFFIVSVWLIPYGFVMTGVIYQKLVD